MTNLAATRSVVPFYLAAADGYRIARYAVALDQVPADFFADPDGVWTWDELADAAGFAFDSGIAIGALRRPFNGHPAGCAVVTLNAATRPYVAIIECPVSFLRAQSA
ncbi:MAG TPA: hypothetical protein VGQ57_11530 [Polyangiaceae bacterium]|jgi:hypothetical protein|nr:hypothetical protein [Polyangiaceae bacterium]